MRSKAISFILVTALAALSFAVRFDLHANTPDSVIPKCFFQYVPKNTKVLVTINVADGYNQHVDFEISDASGSLLKKKNIKNDINNAFDTSEDGNIKICFTNTLEEGFVRNDQYVREVELEVNVGTEAKTIEEITKNKHLPSLEEQTRVLEAMVDDILNEMNYLKEREARMRNTNESTNDRVKWFSLLSLFTLISLGIWQILYLRSYFRRKRLID
ncbi:unnamed protein product [Cunninghamella blakesleeana]